MHPWTEKALLALAPPLLSGALRLVSATWKLRLIDAELLFATWTQRPVILAFWHNRVLPLPLVARGQRVCILNSQSRDGEIATRALARWNIHSVRGSATRGGEKGFLALVRAQRRGYHLAVVPDGPRGPRYVVKPGVIHLARFTGAPIFPVTASASRFHQLRSWDRLLVPLPFAEVRYYVGEPLEVAAHSDEARLEHWRRELEQRLRQLTERADQETASAPPH